MKLKASWNVLSGDGENLNYKTSRDEYEQKTTPDEFENELQMKHRGARKPSTRN